MAPEDRRGGGRRQHSWGALGLANARVLPLVSGTGRTDPSIGGTLQPGVRALRGFPDVGLSELSLGKSRANRASGHPAGNSGEEQPKDGLGPALSGRCVLGQRLGPPR